jgi:phosphate transport system substrate-binding protein
VEFHGEDHHVDFTCPSRIDSSKEGALRMKRAIILLAAAIFLFWCTATRNAEAGEKQTVRVVGAGLLSEWLQEGAELYMKGSPDCSITIAGATTGVGVRRLMEGNSEIGALTRQLTAEEAKKAQEQGLVLSSKQIGYIGLAVITNNKNSVSELTMDQLAKIFKGEISNWSQVGGQNQPIKVTMRPVPETGAGVLFQRKVLNGAPYVNGAAVMTSYNTTVSVCSKSFGIGYIPTTTTYFDKLEERGVKIIRIRQDANSKPFQLAGGVSKDASYPISIGVYFYWNAKLDNPCAKGLVDFVYDHTQ